MATIQTNIRWADNTAELRKNLLQGIDTIDAMKSAVDRTVRSLGGEGLFAAANKTAAAIVQLGGVTKLTAAEQERANALLEKAIAKYEQMGQTVPTALRQIADATKKANDETSGWLPLLQELGSSWVARVAEGILLRDAIHKLLDVMVEGLELFPEMVQHTIELGSQLLTMSLKTGISVESLSKLRYVAQQTGTDLPSLTTAIFKMQASLGAVGDESKKTQDALAKLHLNLSDLKNSKPDEAFTTILDKMRELPTVADRAGVGMALFGKGWREVSQLAVEDIKGLMHEAEELGIVMTTETAAAAKAAEDGLAALKAQIEGLTVRIGAAFLPAVIGISHDLSEMFKVAVDESNKSLDAMGKSDGYLATVSRAMGTGSGAIAAQTELYYVLRDAVIALVRNGLEPAITAIGFVGQEFNAAKVVVGDVTQAFALLELGATKLAKFKLQSSDILGIDPNTQKSIKEAQQHIDELNASIAARGASLKAAKSAENDWANSAANANATIESALKKIEASHMDVAAVIKSVSDMSRAAAQNSGTAMDEMTSKERSELDKLQKALEDIAAVYNVEYLPAIDKVGRATYETIVALKENGISVEELALAYRLSKADVELLIKAHEAEGRTLEIVRGIEKTALAESLKEYDKWAAGVSKAADEVGKSLIDQLKLQTEFTTKLRDLSASPFTKITNEWSDALNRLGPPMKGFEAQWQRSVDAVNDYFTAKLSSDEMAAAVKAAGESDARGFTAGFSVIVTEIPGILESAFTGGGGLDGAIKAIATREGTLLGSALAGSGFGQGFADKLGGLFGVKTAEGAGAVARGLTGVFSAGIGTAINFGIGLLSKGLDALFHLGGPSQAELEARKSVAVFEAQLAGTLTATQKIEAGNLSWKETTIAVRDAYLATGRSEEEAEAAVKRLWDSSRQGAEATKAAIDEINGVFDEQKQDAADLQTAIQRYGFSIEQLGPAMQKQKLDEQAKQLLNDWRLLVGSGIDIVAVDQKMASSTWDYLQIAKRTGQEVPDSMKPILQSMLDQGVFTDEAGNKLTDLSQLGVKFSETMTSGFDRVVAKLQTLLEGLGLVPKALDKIPDTKDIDITTHYHSDGSSLPPGAETASRQDTAPAFASEAYVRAPTLATVGDVLGGEFVLKPSTLNEWLGSAASMGALLPRSLVGDSSPLAALSVPATTTQGGYGQAPIVMNETVQVSLTVQAIDSRGMSDAVEKTIMPMFIAELEDGRRNYASRLRRVIASGE